MDLGIQGKVAMVAAASMGIGLAIAKALVQEGARVSICARNEDALTAALEELGEENAETYVVDVSNPDDLNWWVEQTVADLGMPEILVTNTGGPPAGKWTEMSDEQWQSGFDNTLMNVVRLMRKVTPMMQERNWGRVVHLTSLVAKEPATLLPISSTLRTGLMSLTRLQATELAPFGITVNSVLPGHTMTDRQTHLAEIRAEREAITVDEALALQAASVPMGRLAEAAEIASAVAYLCSAQAGYITGVNLLVDGGLTRTFG